MSDNKPEQTAAAKLAGGPACACQRVSYDPIKHDDGGFSERWRCEDCKSEFIRDRPAVPRLPMTREQLEEIVREQLEQFRYVGPLHMHKSIADKVIDAFAPYLDSEPEQPEPQPAPVELECPEVYREEVIKVVCKCQTFQDWQHIDYPLRNDLQFIAQHFQSRGFELGRAAASGIGKAVETLDSECLRLVAEIESLNSDLIETRRSHARIYRKIKSLLGLKNWPDFEGDFQSGVHKLLSEFIESLQRQLATVSEERGRLREWKNGLYTSGGGWIYQGDGEDHLESLTRPVIIRPETLLEIIKDKGAYSILSSVHMEQIRELQAELTRLKSQPLTPVAGPPTMEALEAAGDDALFLIRWDWPVLANLYFDSNNEPVLKTHKGSVIKRENFGGVDWHLGPITPPEPQEEELPKCPVCGEAMAHTYDKQMIEKCRHRISCELKYENHVVMEHKICFYGPTRESAIAAARAAGEGE